MSTDSMDCTILHYEPGLPGIEPFPTTYLGELGSTCKMDWNLESQISYVPHLPSKELAYT